MEFIKDIAYVTAKLQEEKKNNAKKVYISGPMTGLPELNYPAFIAKEKELIAKGYEVINPVTLGEELKKSNPNPSYEDYMTNDLNAIKEHAQAICFLDKWWLSKGAMREAKLASELGLPAIQ